jgi:hypothetical protein
MMRRVSLGRLLLGAVLVALAGGLSPAAALRITELMASNAMTITDEDGAYSDWLELHNETGAPVDVVGHYLTDDATVLTKWQLPSVVIPSGGYLLVWASNKNRASPPAPLHTNFALSTGGDYLAVVAPNGTTVLHAYAPQYPPQTADVSYGLASDLTTERCFLDPTPGAANDETPACVFVAPVVFSVPHGFFDAPFTVALSTPTVGATIHYTTDGSEPTDAHGTVYAAPISITTTTPLRAMAFLPGSGSTKSATQTYIFLDDVLVQSAATIPPGYPAQWGANTDADYEMDPQVVNDPLYAGEMHAALQAIPTLSVVTDRAHLFDAQTGIYVNTFGRGDAWQRPASAELIPVGGGTGFQKNCGIRIQGETSRSPTNKKYSLSLRFRGQYDGDLAFPLFPGAPVDTFHTLRLNARHQNTWHSSYGGDPQKALYVRDNYARETLADMGQLSTHFLYVHVYLNGIYWGLYSLHEQADEDFLSSYLGGEPEDWDVFKDGPLEAGNRDASDDLAALLQQNLSVPANYAAVLAVIDVDNLIDYMLMNFYIGNRDWYANWYVGRRRVPDGKWMWFAWDSEFILGTYREGVLGGDGPLGVYGRLKADSAEFRLRFADRVHQHLFNDGALTPEQAAARLLRNTDVIQSAVIGESARWGDKLHPDRPYTRDNEWLVEKQRLLLEYFPRRTAVLLDQLRGAGLYPNVEAPRFNQHGGDFLPGFALTMSAPVGAIYYTMDGSDPRLAGGGVSPGAQAYGAAIPLSTSVTASARVLSGGTWSALTRASFAQASPVRVTEIMYNGSGGSDYDYIELANIGSGPVDLAGYQLSEGITFVFPAYVLAAGAHVLVVKNQTVFETRYGTGKPIAGLYGGNLSDGGERLVVLDGAAGVIHDFTYDDAWYPSTDGGGFSLVVRDVTAARSAWDGPAGWRASTFLYGSPGAAELPACGDGVDNDGDTAIDLGDPGCAAASQDHEDPACNDGVDNDDDGEVDLGDAQCSSASEDSEAANPVDPLLCYRVRRNTLGTPVTRVDVTLSDTIDGTVEHTVLREGALCLPGSLNQTPVIDPTTNVESYVIRTVTGQPQHVPRADVRVENAFGTIFVDTKGKPDRLLMPAAVSLASQPLPPDNNAHDVDHYKCYRTAPTAGRPKYFPRSAQANHGNAFEERDYGVGRPKHLCAPVDQEGQGIKNPDGYLLCYPAKAVRFSPAHTRRVGVYVATELGDERLDSLKEEELCVPSHVTAGP